MSRDTIHSFIYLTPIHNNCVETLSRKNKQTIKSYSHSKLSNLSNSTIRSINYSKQCKKFLSMEIQQIASSHKFSIDFSWTSIQQQQKMTCVVDSTATTETDHACSDSREKKLPFNR